MHRRRAAVAGQAGGQAGHRTGTGLRSMPRVTCDARGSVLETHGHAFPRYAPAFNHAATRAASNGQSSSRLPPSRSTGTRAP